MRTYKTILLTFAAFAMLAVLPATAQAQRHGPGVRVGIVVRGGFGGGYFYDQYPWYPYPYNYPYPYPYPPYRYYNDDSAALRLQVTPKQADVYIDGYHAGIVDDFDGVFQRLHVRPGGHELVLFLEGFRTIRQSVYLNPNQTQSIRLTMVRLGPGESSGPRPEPPPPPMAQAEQPGQPGMRMPMRPGQPPAPGTVQAGPPQPMSGQPGNPPPPPSGSQYPEAPQQVMPMRAGVLAIRAQPADAEIWLDGTIWHGPRPRAQVLIQLGEGTHKLELRKAGYDTFSADVMVRAGQTTTVNVTLTKGHQ